MTILSSAYNAYIVALESTYNTDAVNAQLIANTDVTYLGINNGGDITPVGTPFTPDRARASQDGVASTFVRSHSEVNLPIEMTGGQGTANTPSYGNVLRAAGFIETIGASSTEYVLGTPSADSISIYKYYRNLTDTNWRLKRATGVLLNMSLSGNAGEAPVLTFAGMGASYLDLSTPGAYFGTNGYPALNGSGGAITYTGDATADNGERLMCVGATITFGATNIPSSTTTLDIAMAVSAINTQQGNPLASRIIRTRTGVSNANGSLGVESSDSMAGYTVLAAAVLANTVGTLTMIYAGPTRKVTVVSNVQFTNRLVERDTGGAMAFDAPFNVVGNFAAHPFGDNSVKMTYSLV